MGQHRRRVPCRLRWGRSNFLGPVGGGRQPQQVEGDKVGGLRFREPGSVSAPPLRPFLEPLEREPPGLSHHQFAVQRGSVRQLRAGSADLGEGRRQIGALPRAQHQTPSINGQQRPETVPLDLGSPPRRQDGLRGGGRRAWAPAASRSQGDAFHGISPRSTRTAGDPGRRASGVETGRSLGSGDLSSCHRNDPGHAASSMRPKSSVNTSKNARRSADGSAAANCWIISASEPR